MTIYFFCLVSWFLEKKKKKKKVGICIGRRGRKTRSSTHALKKTGHTYCSEVAKHRCSVQCRLASACTLASSPGHSLALGELNEVGFYQIMSIALSFYYSIHCGLEIGAHPVQYVHSSEEKLELLNAHNLYRSDAAVRFGAANIRTVVSETKKMIVNEGFSYGPLGKS